MIRIDPPQPPRRSGIARIMRRRRRSLAAVAAAAATAILGSSVLTVVSPPTADVVVAAGPVAAGATLTAADITLRSWPVDLLPDSALTDPTAAVGGAAATAIAEGELLTAPRLVPAGGQHLAGRVNVVAGLADPWAAQLVVPGSHVDVYPAGGWADAGAGEVSPPLARDAVVVRLLGAAQRPAPGIDVVADPLAGDAIALVLAVRTADVPAIAAMAGQGVTIATVP